MQDITPIIGKEKKVIKSYGAGGFKINEDKIESSIFLLPDSLQEIDAEDISLVSGEQITPFIEKSQKDIEILLVGAGENTDFLNSDLEKQIRSNSISIEYMDTGAACRTYNILLSEERKVAAILIKV